MPIAQDGQLITETRKLLVEVTATTYFISLGTHIVLSKFHSM
jgi:hypothetical protein